MAFSEKKQANKRFHEPRQVSELISRILDPVMQQRAGMTMQLVLAWEDIIGATHAKYTRPEKLEWPRQASQDDAFEPATLRIACEGARAIYVQHEAGLIVERVNGFFGFHAVERIRIVQKPLQNPLQNAEKPRRSAPKTLNNAQKQRLDAMLHSIEDEKLRQALLKMGEGVLGAASD